MTKPWKSGWSLYPGLATVSGEGHCPPPCHLCCTCRHILLIHLHRASDSHHLHPGPPSPVSGPPCLGLRLLRLPSNGSLVSILHRVVRSIFLEHHSPSCHSPAPKVSVAPRGTSLKPSVLSSTAHPSWIFQIFSSQALPCFLPTLRLFLKCFSPLCLAYAARFSDCPPLCSAPFHHPLGSSADPASSASPPDIQGC